MINSKIILAITVIVLIIHSKYFPNSDWLKAHTQFIITINWRPNLEEFCV